MSSGKKAALGAGLGVGALVAVWSLVGRLTGDSPPVPMLRWQCSACGEVFEARPRGPAGQPRGDVATVPKMACPKCGGAAYRLARFRCTACSHEFDFLLRPARGGQPRQPRCPKCNDPRVAPVQALEKR